MRVGDGEREERDQDPQMHVAMMRELVDSAGLEGWDRSKEMERKAKENVTAAPCELILIHTYESFAIWRCTLTWTDP